MSHALYELDVRLRNISPPIWRTIELDGSSTLEDVHYAIQSAMGWDNSHLHQFTIGKRSYGMVDIDGPSELEDERGARLQEVAKRGDKLVYVYDFGDDWEHDITIERVTTVAKPPPPRCTAGQRACPPEDCGGPWGYERLLRAIADPGNPEHAELVEWAGDFEPEELALPKAGRELRPEMDERKALAEEGRADLDDEDDEDGAFGLPRPLVEAVLSLDPMQRASLSALIAGSLAEELAETRAVTAQLLEGLKRQHKPARSHRKTRRS
jgi:hypothetical protein